MSENRLYSVRGNGFMDFYVAKSSDQVIEMHMEVLKISDATAEDVTCYSDDDSLAVFAGRDGNGNETYASKTVGEWLTEWLFLYDAKALPSHLFVSDKVRLLPKN